MFKQQLYIGIDLGTSGVRACAIDHNKTLIHSCSSSLPAADIDQDSITQDPQLWWLATRQVLTELLAAIDASQLVAISVNGTSGTVLACDQQGTPLAPARMYNDRACSEQAALLDGIAPADSAAHGASCGLAKLLYLHQQYPQAKHLLHQADWIVGKLCGRFDISDENNALKSGYDPRQGKWPDWLNQLPIEVKKLPDIVPPGRVIQAIDNRLFGHLRLNPQCQLISGTTDSIAAFIATGASQPGDAVTSLGSTLVLKIISDKPIFSPEYGIYSHKLGPYWLAGGASNSGGAVLKHYFSQQQLNQMTSQLQPAHLTGLNYYPLLQQGERFPVNDPQLQPRLEPAAHSEVEFFQAILEGIGQIEREGYNKLHQLGAPFPVQVETAGGGSHNEAWSLIRQQLLGVPVKQAVHSDACYGSALLAWQGCNPAES